MYFYDNVVILKGKSRTLIKKKKVLDDEYNIRKILKREIMLKIKNFLSES